MQDKLHETIKQLENEKSLWLQKVVCIYGHDLKKLFFAYLFFSEAFICYKCIHHSMFALTFSITTPNAVSTCSHSSNGKDLSEAYLNLPFSNLQSSTAIEYPRYKTFLDLLMNLSLSISHYTILRYLGLVSSCCTPSLTPPPPPKKKTTRGKTVYILSLSPFYFLG